MIHLKPTSRGFQRGLFVDRYGAECSIQESSLATESCVWLGCRGNMAHLTQDMAADLIPLLQHFVDTGHLPAATQVGAA